ncbi:MAG: DNA mismatch repair protein MutS [Alphaproteobacteria bacterium]|jgi:DNA mismatch repair protein MutS
MTPMMEQYYNMRDANPGFLLFYRMGDFYELFSDHAVTASALLGITLTKRRSAKDGDAGIPMCGVPFHAAEGYIAKLLKAGHKVALCEQTETPEQAKKARGYKALVNREVVRLYTGGTLTEESMLQAEENNYLSALYSVGGELALGYLDISTGEFKVTSVTETSLSSELARLHPKEILITESFADKYKDDLRTYTDALTIVSKTKFDNDRAEKALMKCFNISTLDAFNFTSKAQISVCGALVSYAEETQTGKLPSLEHPSVLRSGSFLFIDPASRGGLELTQTLKGERKGSFISTIDRTVTPAGKRVFSNWITAPLQDLQEIKNRQDSIEALIKQKDNRADIQQSLKQGADISRALCRITLERGSPKDLVAIKNTLTLLPQIQTKISKLHTSLTKEITKNTSGFEALSSLLEKSLEDDVPMLARDGGFIKKGYCADFDAYKDLATNGMDMLKKLEAAEATRTGISSLRIKYNKVWGYFMEVTKTHADKIPTDFIHRQTTTNAQRFSSTVLMELERKYSAAQANMLTREQALFAELIQATAAMAPELMRAADGLAQLDTLCAGAEIAEEYNYCRPTIDNSLAFTIRQGRHSVVEQNVEDYIANDSELSDGKLWLITGPNMAGKSTFLRQNALITILAHAGFYVPASQAHIGLVDRIFTRIGAADDLSRGQSTFMMEMVETAAIMNGATERSLVILDEIGRGTATYDGLSIAWAAVEHIINKNKSRGLFATHYHEMAELESQYENLECFHVQVKEWQGDIIFLHSIGKGIAPASYGIHVGRLAGLPKSVTHRAEQILNRLEKSAGTGKNLSPVDLPLFTTAPAEEAKETSALEARLSDLSLDDLTPKEAHNLLYDLKSMVVN